MLGAGEPPALSAEVSLQFDGAASAPEALKALGISDPATLKLVSYLEENGPRIAQALQGNAELSALLARDPAAALGKLDVPPELFAHTDVELRNLVTGAFSGIRLDFGSIKFGPAKPFDPTQDAVAKLFADTSALTASDPAYAASLAGNPAAAVIEAARRHPVALADPGAQIAVINRVITALAAASGAPASLVATFTHGGSITQRVPFPRFGP